LSSIIIFLICRAPKNFIPVGSAVVHLAFAAAAEEVQEKITGKCPYHYSFN
jgi:hypothetical protein